MIVKICGVPLAREAYKVTTDILDKVSHQTCSINNHCVDQVAVWSNSPADYMVYLWDSYSSVEGFKHMVMERVHDVSDIGHGVYGVVSQLF